MAKKTVDFYTGDDARSFAMRKATYGRRDWIVWHDKDGASFAAICTPEYVKQALLAVGTQGFFTRYYSGGAPILINWQLGVMWLRSVRNGNRWHFSQDYAS